MKNTMNRALLFFILCLCGGQLFASSNLTVDEVRELFTGNTAEGERREYEKPGYGPPGMLINFAEEFVSYYAEDGNVRKQSGEQRLIGKWRVTEKGELCIEWEGKNEKCAPVSRQKDAYKRVIKNKMGRPLKEIKYLKFSSGNTNNL